MATIRRRLSNEDRFKITRFLLIHCERTLRQRQGHTRKQTAALVGRIINRCLTLSYRRPIDRRIMFRALQERQYRNSRAALDVAAARVDEAKFRNGPTVKTKENFWRLEQRINPVISSFPKPNERRIAMRQDRPVFKAHRAAKE